VAPPVTLLLPNRDNAGVLDLVLGRLAENTDYPDFELLVVDDGSTDGSVELLRRWRDSGRFPGFKLIEREASGVIESLNAGLAEATGEVIVRLDGDATIETPGWLGRMLDFHSSDERIGVVVAKIVFDSGHIHNFGMDIVVPEGLHDRGTQITEPAGRRTLDINVERPLEADAEGGDRIAEVDGAIGCCTMFSRELAERIGGFDTVWSPVAFEDFDFALSARREGYKVFFFPEVEVIHRVSLRNPREDSRKELWMWRARRAVGDYVPLWLRKRVAQAAKIADHDPARVALLERHYASWREKWGWDPINPDLDAITARWGGTEVCWRYDDERRAAGERIAAGWNTGARTLPSPESR
jgi:GT2 family glycosyltransferase